MAGRVDDYERTMAFADIALGQIKALRQFASPRNYEIWYAYARGYHPALNQQINATLKASRSPRPISFRCTKISSRQHG